MNKISDVIGSRINSIIYRGESIFTINLEDKNGKLIDLNLLGCEYLELGDVINGEITKIGVQSLGIKHINIIYKRNLEKNEFKSIYIEVRKHDNLFSLYGLIKKIDIDGHSQKYNPISDDKYL